MLDEPTNGLDPAGRDEMLDMIRRVGHEFNISILMSSHLLGEIERVCDYLVVIDGGRLMSANSIASFTASMQLLAVEVDSRADVLQARLQDQGLTVSLEGRKLLIGLDGDYPYDVVRDEVAELGIGLLRMEQQRHSLEDIFRSDGEADG
jgi:ABC-2 type transport system ATP-binding protein